MYMFRESTFINISKEPTVLNQRQQWHVHLNLPMEQELLFKDISWVTSLSVIIKIFSSVLQMWNFFVIVELSFSQLLRSRSFIKVCSTIIITITFTLFLSPIEDTILHAALRLCTVKRFMVNCRAHDCLVLCVALKLRRCDAMLRHFWYACNSFAVYPCCTLVM